MHVWQWDAALPTMPRRLRKQRRYIGNDKRSHQIVPQSTPRMELGTPPADAFPPSNDTNDEKLSTPYVPSHVISSTAPRTPDPNAIATLVALVDAHGGWHRRQRASNVSIDEMFQTRLFLTASAWCTALMEQISNDVCVRCNDVRQNTNPK